VGPAGRLLARALVEPLATSILAAALWRRARAIDR
jgi:hypothetical protein